LRIALLTSQWPGVRLGGIGAYTLHAARALSRAGHEVHLFTFTLPPDVPRNLGPRTFLHEVPSVAEALAGTHPPAHLRELFQTTGASLPAYRLAMATLLTDALLKVHADIPFDIAEGPEYEALTLPLTQNPPDNLRIITHLHSGSAIARHTANLPFSDEQTLAETLELSALLGSDAVCAPSRAVFDDSLAASSEFSRITPHIIPLPFDPPDTPFQLPPPNAPLLFIGRLEFLKGAHLLIDAANRFLPHHPAATLRIAGPDTATAPTGNRASMLAWMKSRLDPTLHSRVAFLGELNRPDLTCELEHCSSVIIPSLRESYSYVCCESLAAGRPVIVSDRTGATEVAGEAGLPFRNGNVQDLARAMEQLWTDRPLHVHLCQAAWHRARNTLASTITTPQRIAFYERVINRPPNTLRDRRKYMDPFCLPSRLPSTIVTPGKRLLHALHALDRPAPTSFYLYGAGRHSLRLLAEEFLWRELGYKLSAIIDDHPRYALGGQFQGFPVHSFDTALRLLRSVDTVILSSDAFEEQLWEKSAPLRAKGVTVLRLYPPTADPPPPPDFSS
jgi:glycosyltransferase involved in cell wall biosynthesis